MAEKTEKTNVTGLDTATNRKEAEYDLVSSLLAAADYKTDDNNIVETKIERNGVYYFTVHLHPISDTDTRLARKKATVYMANPNGKKLPPIEKEFNSATFKSWLIYLSTTEEDQQKIWGNTALMQKHSLAQPWESIDVLLAVGEKNKIFELVTEISGLDEDGNFDGDEEMDEESFRGGAD